MTKRTDGVMRTLQKWIASHYKKIITRRTSDKARNLQKWVTLYHITSQMRYNDRARDNSNVLLQQG